MSNYKELKNAFREELSRLDREVNRITAIINRHKRIDDIINESLGKVGEESKIEKLNQVKRFFPEYVDDFNAVESLGTHKWTVLNDPFNKFRPRDLINEITIYSNKYSYVTPGMIEEIKKDILELERVKATAAGFVPTIEEDFKNLVKRQATKIAELALMIEDIQVDIGNKLLDKIDEIMSKTDIGSLLEAIDGIKQRIKFIKEYNSMFSKDKLLRKFNNDEEFELFKELIKSLLDDNICEEILSNIAKEEIEEDEEVIITFDNLDLSKFTEEEREIIREIHKIIENEELNENDKVTIGNISYSDRIDIYKKETMNHILVDIKNNLVTRIYDDKTEVINTFKFVINLYNKYTTRLLRIELEKSFLRIKNDFDNIVNFINKTYIDKNKAFEITRTINGYIKTINLEYIPMLEELINTNYDDDYYDKEFERIIAIFKGIIRNYKKEMSAYNTIDEKVEDVKENTDNLVFCLTDDIDLSMEGYQKEFVGTIVELELKSALELNKGLGRKSMSKLRRADDKEDSLINYLEKRERRRLFFVPCRYSSESNYRTGLIRFEPSSTVKQFLEERYGLSKQSAIYGIFRIIQVIRSDHSEYGYLREYVFDNFMEIEELARMFASDNPDWNKLSEKVDKMLAIKKDMLNKIENKKSRK